MAPAVRERLVHEPDQAAPHAVDVAVLGVIRRLERAGEIDGTAAALAIDDLRDWPGERVGHRALLPRAWELRHRVRGWDAMYVVLAELLDVPLLTLDSRLSRVGGPTCRIDVVG